MEPSRARGPTREVADCSFGGGGPLPRHPVTGRLVHVPWLSQHHPFAHATILRPRPGTICQRSCSFHCCLSRVAAAGQKGRKAPSCGGAPITRGTQLQASTAAPSISGRRRAHRPPTKLAISEIALNRTVLRACRLQNARVSDAAHRCACHAAPGTRLTTRSAPSRCRHRWRSGERTRRRICR